MVRTQKSVSIGSGSIGPNYIVPTPTGSRDPGIGILPNLNPGIEKSIPGLQSLTQSLYLKLLKWLSRSNMQTFIWLTEPNKRYTAVWNCIKPDIVVGRFYHGFFFFFVSYSRRSLNGTQPKAVKCLEVSAIWQCMSEIWGISFSYISGSKTTFSRWLRT